jgi:hypothetical protein
MSENYPQDFRSPKILSFFVMAGIALVALFDFISGAIGVGQVINPNLSWRYHDGSIHSIWLVIQSLAVLFKFLIFIVAGILFLVWLNRANKNLYELQPQHVEFSSGWAVGWWFVPFASLVKPFQVVREVWWESDPNRSNEHQFLSASLHSAPVYMGFWWAAWLISNLLENITFRVFDADNLASVGITGFLFIGTGIVSVIAACLAIYLVYDITRRQNERFNNLLMNRPTEVPPTFSGRTFGS